MKKEHTLRHPIVNGLFYPDSKDQLQNSIKGYLEKIDRKSLLQSISDQTGFEKPSETVPLVLISPHAGYIFSGAVQAYTYLLLGYFDTDTVIIIGPAHQTRFSGISVNLDDAYKTPLGTVEVDLEFAYKLTACSDAILQQLDAHLNEHSVEVQIPFIQQTVPGARIVPILFGDQNLENALMLKNALVSVMNDLHRKYCIVVSTDLSHYHSHVDASRLDKVLIDDVRNLDTDAFSLHIQEGKSEACGFGGILTGMLLVNEIGEGKSAILHYMDSGEVSGDRRNVVGYVSAVLY